MNYFEILTLKRLLKKYINDVVVLDKTDIIYKINEEILDDLAIIVNRHLQEGQMIENIIRNKLENNVLEMIKEVCEFNINRGDYIKPRKLKKQLKNRIKQQI